MCIRYDPIFYTDILLMGIVNFSLQISFLDYMCYIPLFLSMHDNICENPLDMSSQKYTRPPRQRPVSVCINVYNM